MKRLSEASDMVAYPDLKPITEARAIQTSARSLLTKQSPSRLGYTAPI